MTREYFHDLLRGALEISNLKLDEATDLLRLEEFDSVGIMSLIALMDQHFDRRLTAEQLASITTVKSLMDVIGEEHFS